MRSTQLILVRHGQTFWNLDGRMQGHLNSPLTELGKLQAESIAKRLAEKEFQAIYSSDLDRAYFTAMCIAEKKGIPVVKDVRLRERNYGIFQGLTRQEMKSKYPEEFHLLKLGEPNFAIPQGETSFQFFQRSISCLEELAARHRGNRIVVVTHHGVLNCLFRHMFGIAVDAPRNFKILEGSLNSVQFKRGKWVLESWGEVGS